MKRQNFLSRILSPIVLGLALVAPAHAFPPKEWRFTVLLDDKPIGQHQFRLALDKAGGEVVSSEADFDVTLLGISAYRYRHSATERWEKGCLTEIKSRTNDNGKTVSLAGERKDNKLVLSAAGSESSLSGCVMSFAYWNPAILEQRRLLNAETGEYHAITVKRLGNESLALPGKWVMAERYRLRADKFSIDLWYGPNGQWLALETKTGSGRNLRYVIEPAFLSQNGRTRHV